MYNKWIKFVAQKLKIFLTSCRCFLCLEFSVVLFGHESEKAQEKLLHVKFVLPRHLQKVVWPSKTLVKELHKQPGLINPQN